MDLFFISPDLHDLCTRLEAMRKRWDKADAEIIARCLQDLDAADRLGDLVGLPYLSVVPTSDGTMVTVHDRKGVRIRLRPQPEGRGANDPERWEESTEVVVLDVLVETG